MQFIENRTFDELHIGDAAEIKRTLRPEDVALVAADGISDLLSTELPGPGTVILDLSLHFRNAANAGDTATVRVRVRDMVPETKQVTLRCEGVAASGEILFDGQARVIAPTLKLRRPRAVASPTLFAAGMRYRELLEAARQYAPIRTAVVHPCDTASLAGAMEAWETGLKCPCSSDPWPRFARRRRTPGMSSRMWRLSMCRTVTPLRNVR